MTPFLRPFWAMLATVGDLVSARWAGASWPTPAACDASPRAACVQRCAKRSHATSLAHGPFTARTCPVAQDFSRFVLVSRVDPQSDPPELRAEEAELGDVFLEEIALLAARGSTRHEVQLPVSVPPPSPAPACFNLCVRPLCCSVLHRAGRRSRHRRHGHRGHRQRSF